MHTDRPTAMQAGREFWPSTDDLSMERIAWGYVMRVSPEEPGADRPRMLVDVMDASSRQMINRCVVLQRSGRSYRHATTYPQVVSKNNAYDPPLVYSTDYARRLVEIRNETRMDGLDGDFVCIGFAGDQAIILGWLGHFDVGADVDPTPAETTGDAKYIGTGKTLVSSAYTGGTDDLPVVRRADNPDALTWRHGRTLATVWSDDGLALEVRDVQGGTVKTIALARVAVQKELAQLRAPIIELETHRYNGTSRTVSHQTRITDADGQVVKAQKFEVQHLTPGDLAGSKPGLLVDEGAAPSGYRSAVKYDELLVVVDKLVDVADERREQLEKLAASYNALVIEHKAIVGALKTLVPQIGATLDAALNAASAASGGQIANIVETVLLASKKTTPTTSERTAMESPRAKVAQ